MHLRFFLAATPMLICTVATGATAQEYCVTCTGPDASYRCLIGGDVPMAARASRGQFLCITEIAKAGGHASCSAARGAGDAVSRRNAHRDVPARRSWCSPAGRDATAVRCTAPLAAPLAPLAADQGDCAGTACRRRSTAGRTARCRTLRGRRRRRSRTRWRILPRRPVRPSPRPATRRQRHEEDVELRHLAVRRLLSSLSTTIELIAWRSTRGRDAVRARSAASTSRGKSRTGSAWRHRCRASPRD